MLRYRNGSTVEPPIQSTQPEGGDLVVCESVVTHTSRVLIPAPSPPPPEPPLPSPPDEILPPPAPPYFLTTSVAMPGAFATSFLFFFCCCCLCAAARRGGGQRNKWFGRQEMAIFRPDERSEIALKRANEHKGRFRNYRGSRLETRPLYSRVSRV